MRAAAADHRAHELRQGGDGVGVELVGAVDAAGVGEQFPDADRVVGQADRAQPRVGRVVQVQAARGGQPEHRGRGDQPGQAGHREPVPGFQRHRLIQVGVAGGDRPGGLSGIAAGQQQGGQPEFSAGPGGDGTELGRWPAGRPDRGRRFDPGIGDPLGEREAPHPDQPVRRLGGSDREVAQAGQLDLRLERRLPDDNQLAPQVGGALGERLGQAVSGEGGQRGGRPGGGRRNAASARRRRAPSSPRRRRRGTGR